MLTAECIGGIEKSERKSRGIPHLAKNERDVGPVGPRLGQSFKFSLGRKHARRRGINRQVNGSVHLCIGAQRTAQQLGLHSLIPLSQNLLR